MPLDIDDYMLVSLLSSVFLYPAFVKQQYEKIMFITENMFLFCMIMIYIIQNATSMLINWMFGK